MQSLRGSLLVAATGLMDPNFRKTVVLLGDHGDEGAFGVVLNQPAGVTVGEVAPVLASAAGTDAPVFIGGPVQPDAVVVVAEFVDPGRLDVAVVGGVGFVTGDVADGALDGARSVRVFAGYSGWGPGQLEAELHEDSWLTLPALASDAFADPASLWTDVVRRLGPDHALLATMPIDPSMN